MAIQLSIHSESCIRCGKCVRVCPSGIFTQATANGTNKTTNTTSGNVTGAIGLENIDSCILCGHCVAACPTDSVRHGDFPSEKVHKIDYAQMPTPEQVMLLIKARRSNRAISRKPVPKEMLDTILEAAHRAPTASNTQKIAFMLVTDPQKLRGVADFTIGVFDGVLRKLQNPVLKPVLRRILPQLYKYIPAFERLKRGHADGKDPILRHATALILIHTPASNHFGAADANLAYQNGSLMAEALGVSQVYMGFVLSALQQKKGMLEKQLDIDGKVHAIMALGMPAFRYPNYIDRKEIVVKEL